MHRVLRLSTLRTTPGFGQMRSLSRRLPRAQASTANPVDPLTFGQPRKPPVLPSPMLALPWALGWGQRAALPCPVRHSPSWDLRKSRRLHAPSAGGARAKGRSASSSQPRPRTGTSPSHSGMPHGRTPHRLPRHRLPKLCRQLPLDLGWPGDHPSPRWVDHLADLHRLQCRHVQGGSSNPLCQQARTVRSWHSRRHRPRRSPPRSPEKSEQSLGPARARDMRPR